MIAPACTIALLGAIESLLSAVVADGMIGSRHRSNVELVAQGIANVVTPLFGGIPATGAIARTATNVKNGGLAIGAGMALAAFLFVRRMANATDVNVVAHVAHELPRRSIPPGVEVYEINGAFFFGAAEKFKDTLAMIAGKPKVLIIRMQGVPVIDATGMHALRDVMRRSRSEGTLVMLSEVQSQPLAALRKSAPADATQQDVICSTFDEAIHRATQYLEPR